MFEAISPKASQGECHGLGPPCGTQRFARAILGKEHYLITCCSRRPHRPSLLRTAFHSISLTFAEPPAQPCMKGFCPKPRAQANSSHRACCSKRNAFPGLLSSRDAGNKRDPAPVWVPTYTHKLLGAVFLPSKQNICSEHEATAGQCQQQMSASVSRRETN